MPDNKIIGAVTENDYLLAEPIDLGEMDINRTDAVNAADDYVNKRGGEKAIAFGGAAVVMAFAVGCGLVGTMWFLASNGYLK